MTQETDADRRWREGVEMQERMRRVEQQFAQRVADAAAAYPPPPTYCPVCGRGDVTIKKDGTLRVHGSKRGWPPSNCGGTGQKPREG